MDLGFLFNAFEKQVVTPLFDWVENATCTRWAKKQPNISFADNMIEEAANISAATQHPTVS